MKRVISLILAICMLLTLAACAKTEAPAAQPTAAETAAPETAAPETEAVIAHYPVTITDHAGREVTLEEKPEKLVSGYYISTSAFLALGLKDCMVGIEAKAEKRPLYRLCAPELIDLPNVGTAKEFDLEGCLALEPDLVVLPIKLKSVVETLEQMQIPVLLVNPESMTQLTEMVDIIAMATDTCDRADALKAFMAEREAALAGIGGEKPVVYMAGNSSLLSTAGAGMYQSDLIGLAGGTNAAAEIEDSSWAEISYEQLLHWDPDYILLASDAVYTVEDVLSDPNLADCTAVKNGSVIHMPAKAEAWDSPVPSGILGAVWLAAQLHGDEFTQEQADAVIDAFYQEFYGFTYSET